MERHSTRSTDSSAFYAQHRSRTWENGNYFEFFLIYQKIICCIKVKELSENSIYILQKIIETVKKLKIFFQFFKIYQNEKDFYKNPVIV